MDKIIKRLNPLDLDIKLFADNIIFFGSTKECSGTTVAGDLLINCLKPLKIKQIKLEFIGDFIFKNKTHKIIFDSKQKFLDSPEYFETGCHFYPFEIVIPGNLPPSINSDMCSISYKFRAKINLVKKASITSTSERKVQLMRTFLPSSTTLFRSLEYSNSWKNKIKYHVSTPNQVIRMNTIIPIDFSIKKYDRNLMLESVTCLIKQNVSVNMSDINDKRGTSQSYVTEYFEYTNEEKMKFLIELPVLKANKDQKYDDFDPLLQSTLEVNDETLVKVNHLIRVSMVILDHSINKRYKVYISLPIKIIDQDSHDVYLPSYSLYDGNLKEKRNYLVETNSNNGSLPSYNEIIN